MNTDTIHPETELRLASAALRAQAAYLNSPRFTAEIMAAAQRGTFLQSVDLLRAELACLVAGDCSREELDHNAKAGVIEKFERAGAVVYSRKSIEDAIRAGRWLGRKMKTN